MQETKVKLLFQYLGKRILFVVSLITIFTLIPYFITDFFVKPHIDRYCISFTCDNSISNYHELISLENLNKAKQEIIDYRNEYMLQNPTSPQPYSDFSYVKTNKLAKNNRISISYDDDSIYTIEVHQKYFKSLAQARRFMKKLMENEKIIGDYQITYLNNGFEIVEITRPYIFLYSLSFSIFLSFGIVLLIYFIKPSLFVDNISYDNKKTFKTPFHKEYWKKSASELKTVKNIVTISILFALQIACKFIPIPSGFGNLGLNFTYIVFCIIAMLYGPIVGLSIGFMSDILGFILKPSSGVFFIGYTISAMISGFIYAICLYKTKVSFTKCLFARVIINLFVNSLLGSIWWWIVMEKTIDLKTYMFVTELPKNILYLIPQSILLYFVIKVLSPVFVKSKVMDEEIAQNMTLF